MYNICEQTFVQILLDHKCAVKSHTKDKHSVTKFEVTNAWVNRTVALAAVRSKAVVLFLLIRC